ncbi:MAG: type VI secretion system contractile sheath large subunit, partial [Planctomycetota bacterium]
DQARARIKESIQTLADCVREDPEGAEFDAFRAIEKVIGQIDSVLTEHLDAILHHPEFRRVEAAWRGLASLVFSTETSELLKIRVLEISQGELAQIIKKFHGTAWDQSPLFKKIYEEAFGMFGGEPFGCLIADFDFGPQPEDVETLTGLGKYCRAACCPMIAGAAPSLVGLESWDQISDRGELLMVQETEEFSPWRALRKNDDAAFVGLAMPRFLGRMPYGPKTNPVAEFDYSESTGATGFEERLLVNSAYAMATNIARAVTLYGIAARIRGVASGGLVEDLPSHVAPRDDGSLNSNSPTEVCLSRQTMVKLSRLGLLPLTPFKDTGMAVFLNASSLYDIPMHTDPEPVWNAVLAARLPYTLFACRFAQTIKCMIRDRIGSFRGPDDIEQFVNAWLAQHVDADRDLIDLGKRAVRPLLEGHVRIAEVDGWPGLWWGELLLRPFFQLEALTQPMRVTFRLPSASG